MNWRCQTQQWPGSRAICASNSIISGASLNSVAVLNAVSTRFVKPVYDQNMKILFICTHNRCRSILCEAITNHLAKGLITACSAGSHPSGQVHPLSVKYLQQRGISTQGLRSQSWDEFADNEPDVVITVCDNAAKEACPVWFGNCVKVHWGLPDPSKLEGSEADIQAAFFSVMATIEGRIRELLDMDLEGMTSSQMESAIQKLAKEA